MTEKNTLLSFVIPCYNSSKTIGSVITEIKETMKKLSQYEQEKVYFFPYGCTLCGLLWLPDELDDITISHRLNYWLPSFMTSDFAVGVSNC